MTGVQTRKMKLRELLEKATDLQEDGTRKLETLNDLNDIITNANEMLKQVEIKDLAQNTDEVLLDAKVVSTATRVCIETSNTLDINMNPYHGDDFAEHLIEYLGGDDEILNWEKIEDDIPDYFKLTPAFSYLYGTFEYETLTPSQRERKKQTRTMLGACEKVRPDNINAISKEEEGVDETVKIMLSVLREVYKENNSEPISYYEFIFDPDDFPKTIENIFHFSFLIRDGAVKIILKNDIPFLVPMSKSLSKDGSGQGHKETVQRVVSVDYQTWQELKSILGISRGLYVEKKKLRCKSNSK